MKKLKLMFTVLAFVLGIGGAIASKFMPPAIGYEFIPATQDEDAWCKRSTHPCLTTGDYPCQVTQSSPVLRDGTDPVSICGNMLRQDTQPPQ